MSAEKEGQDKGKTSRLESAAKVIGIVAAIVTAVLGIIQLDRAVDQYAEDLRWKQASLAREMTNKMVEDEGWQAVEMLDWEETGSQFEIEKGQKAAIKASDVSSALDTSKKEKDLTKKDRFIRYRFDRLFFLVSQLQSAVSSKLVRLDDVRFPLAWYAKNRICRQKAIFEKYMEQNAAPETLQFFRSLREWTDCR